MLIHAKDVKGFKLDASDGEIGKVKEFYFDDALWIIRYLVADTGGWLTGRQVLLSPLSLKMVDEENEKLIVALTKEMIENSPPIIADRPVSRQSEVILTEYYGWPTYWEKISREIPGDPNLRSTREVIDYEVEALDGKLGKIIDFVIDDRDWDVRYIIVDAHGRQVLLALEWVTKFDEESKSMVINVKKDVVKDGPVYDPQKPINRFVETELFDHYKKKYYWG